MLLKLWRDWRFPIEFALLLGVAFFMPLREAPKNLFWLAYTIAWILNRVASRQFGGAWDRWDSLFVVWIGSGYLAALFAGIRTPDANEWGAVNDLVRYVLLAWCVKRGGYTQEQALLLLGVLIGSSALATVEAIWRWKVLSARKALELVSVGHVNHSAIYLVISVGVAVGILASLWRQLNVSIRSLLGMITLLMTVAVFMTGSRAAFATILPLILLCTFFAFRAARLGGRAWIAVILALGVGLAIAGLGTVERHVFHTQTNNITSERDLIWNRAMVAVRSHPWFGVGMDNFGRITDERLSALLREQGRENSPGDYRHAPHAHSLYVNTLTERGLFGLCVLLTVLALWGSLLWQERPRTGNLPGVTALWCASFSGLFVTVVIGLANTTLHHEHALLAMLTLALWLPLSSTSKAAG